MPDSAKDAKPMQPTYHVPSYQYKEHWTTAVGDHLRHFTVQLATTGGAGAIARTAVAPLERAKILLQVQRMSSVPLSEQYSGAIDALRRIPLREGGYQALYRGNGANLMRLVPDVGVKYWLHDQVQVLFCPVRGEPTALREKVAAGATTGAARTLLFYPLDACYTRIVADTAAAGSRQYRGLRDCMLQTWQREGFHAWYRGMGLSLLVAVPNCTVMFATYDELKGQLPTDKRSRAAWWYPWAKMGCGAAAGAAAQLATYPLDTMRRRLQVNRSPVAAGVSYRGVLPMLSSMLRKEGVSSLYRGCTVTMAKAVPAAAVQFMAYDLIRCGVTALDPTSNVHSAL